MAPRRLTPSNTTRFVLVGLLVSACAGGNAPVSPPPVAATPTPLVASAEPQAQLPVTAPSYEQDASADQAATASSTGQAPLSSVRPTASVAPLPSGGPETKPTPQPRVALAGKCVVLQKDAQEDFRRERRKQFPKEQPVELDFQEWELGDLDGDGQPDKALLREASSTTTYWIYVMRGSCGHRVAEMTQFVHISIGPGTSHGLRDIQGTIVCREGTRAPRVDYVWKYDGRRYHLAWSDPNPPPCS